MSTRRVAFEVLTRVEREDAWVAPLIESSIQDDRDRRFVRTLVLGVLRWRSRLDFVIESLSGRAIGKIDPPFRQILRIGIVQLMYTDVAPHAAVNETVSLCAGKLARGRGMVNAVLRRATRESLHDMVPPGDSAREIGIRTGHPEWMIRRWIERFGATRAEAIAAANQELSTADLIVNTRKITPHELRAAIESAGGDLSPSPWFDDVFRSSGSSDAHRESIERGWAYSMDEASVAVARSFASPARSGVTLDLSAAPGGKTIVMTLDGARVVANDISLSRLLTLRTSHRRLFDSEPRAMVSDGTIPAFRREFERVLLDAPCSATGIIRRNPEIRWRLKESDIEAFAGLQRKLLSSAMEICGDELIYSTCSLEREENEAVVDACMEKRDEWELDAIVPENGELARWVDGKALRITPESGADGFTIHRIRRRQG